MAAVTQSDASAHNTRPLNEGPVLDVRDLRMRYGSKDVLTGVNFTAGRGVEALGSVWSFLDLTPLGRQETWEDSPAGWPLGVDAVGVPMDG